jgi:hypothetical protein
MYIQDVNKFNNTTKEYKEVREEYDDQCNKQNTTEKPIKMTAIKNGQSRDTVNIGK